MDWLSNIALRKGLWISSFPSRSSLLRPHERWCFSEKDRNMFDLESFLKFILVATFISKPVCAFNLTECEAVEGIHETAGTYWPFDVICDSLWQTCRSRHPSTLDDQFECKIAREGEDIGQQLCNVASFNGSGVYDIELILNESSCENFSTLIDVQPFLNSSCQDFVNSGEVIHKEATVDDNVEFLCRPDGDLGDIIPPTADQYDYSTEWTMNCGSEDYIFQRPVNYVQLKVDPGYPKSLVILGIDFFNTGVLTCSVTHRGRKLYVVAYSLCIKQRPKEDRPTILCTPKENIDRGGTVVFDCDSQLPSGITAHGDFAIEWIKDGNVVCRSQFFNQTTVGVADGRFSCFAKSSNDSVPCAAFGDGSQDASKVVKAEMRLSDVAPADFGNFEAVVKFKGRTEVGNMTLTEDLIPFYKRIAAILSALLALVLVGIAMSVTYKKNKLLFDLMVIKIIGQYNNDGESLFLSYLYLTYQPEEERSSIMRIYHTATKLTLCFDVAEQRDPNQGIQEHNPANGMERCHSSLLVIANHYLGDERARHEAELAFNRLMERKSRVILVMLPQGEEMLNDAARNDRVWNKIFTASKVFGNFTWKPEASHDVNENALRNYINKRLPKGQNHAAFYDVGHQNVSFN